MCRKITIIANFLGFFFYRPCYLWLRQKCKCRKLKYFFQNTLRFHPIVVNSLHFIVEIDLSISYSEPYFLSKLILKLLNLDGCPSLSLKAWEFSFRALRRDWERKKIQELLVCLLLFIRVLIYYSYLKICNFNLPSLYQPNFSS